MTDSTQAEVPAGMTPWHGGDVAPDDWDGGKVAFRNGQVGHHLLHNEWFAWTREEDGDNAEHDIIAYTPTPSTSVQGAGEAFHETGVSLNVADRQALARAIDPEAFEDTDNFDRSISRSMARAEAFSAADRVAALSTPPAPASVADREQIADIIAANVSGPAHALGGEQMRRAHRKDQLAAADKIMLAFAARPAGEGEVEALARKIEAALCIEADRSPGSIWSTPRGRVQMMTSARAALATEGTPA